METVETVETAHTAYTACAAHSSHSVHTSQCIDESWNISHFYSMRYLKFKIEGSWNISKFNSKIFIVLYKRIQKYLTRWPHEIFIMLHWWILKYLTLWFREIFITTCPQSQLSTYQWYTIFAIFLFPDIRDVDICHSYIWDILTLVSKLSKTYIFCKTCEDIFLLIRAKYFHWGIGLSQAGTLAWRKIISLAGVFEHNRWHSNLDVEAHTKRVMVAVVGRIPSEVEAGQLRLWIPGIGMVDPATPHMSWRLRKLMEAQIDEHSG